MIFAAFLDGKNRGVPIAWALMMRRHFQVTDRNVWSYDFVEDRTHEGMKYRMLNVIDEFTQGGIRLNGSGPFGAVGPLQV